LKSVRPTRRGDRTDYSSDELAHVVPSVAHSFEAVATVGLGLKRRVPLAPVNQRLDGVADQLHDHVGSNASMMPDRQEASSETGLQPWGPFSGCTMEDAANLCEREKVL
jgi:hypothetical protein